MKNKSKNSHEWQYCSIGGVSRVAVNNGEDIAELSELDQKLWTVHSCPVDNLIFDRTTLAALDSDSDGRIRVNEVSDAAAWAASALKDVNLLTRGASSISLDDFNTDSETGASLKAAAVQVLEAIGSGKNEISVEDIEKYAAGVEERCKAAKEEAAAKAVTEAPYGDNSSAAAEACAALRSKIDDYFLRCSLICFDEDCAKPLDVSLDKIAAIGGGTLSADNPELSALPLARPVKSGVLPLNEGINPAWQAAFSRLKSLVFDVDYPGADGIDRNQWMEVLARTDGFTASKVAVESGSIQALDSSLAAQTALVSPLNRFIHLYRDLNRFIRNYVSFNELYSNLEESVINVGKLFIDQRCCELCIQVKDMGQHGDMAGLSGMFLIYCDCTQRKNGEKMQILAALTDGQTRNVRAGKNAVFYDRQGMDWDAVVTKVVTNPINLRQAFWSPYRRFFNWCGEQINKLAADKESKSFDNLKDSATTSIADAQADGTAAPKKQAFDIAKFCGIFAAIGLALGYIGGFLASVWKGFINLDWWQMPLSVVAVILVISLPSVFIAWGKLRRRDLAPVLNANGWAVNASIPVNIKFGKFLTHSAKFPKARVSADPFAKPRSAAWVKWLATVLFVAAAAAAYIIFFR